MRVSTTLMQYRATNAIIERETALYCIKVVDTRITVNSLSH